MKKSMVGLFPDSMSAILAAAMLGGMDGGTMIDLVPNYRDTEGCKSR